MSSKRRRSKGIIEDPVERYMKVLHKKKAKKKGGGTIVSPKAKKGFDGRNATLMLHTNILGLYGAKE